MSATRTRTAAHRSDGKRTNGARPTNNPTVSAATSSAARTLIERIDEQLKLFGEDLDRCAENVLAGVTAEEQADILYHAIRDRISRRATDLRSAVLHGHHRPQRGPSRWSRFDVSVVVEGERKMLGDCTVPDLRALVRQHERAAVEEQATANDFAEMAKELEASGCKTMGALWRKKGLTA